LDDLIIGAIFADASGASNAGKSYVVFGKQDNTAINLSAIIAGTGGFVINGKSGHDYSGFSVSSAGDVNGDGLDDLIVGAYQADPSSSAVILLALMMIVSLPKPALKTSMPPLPVRVSLPIKLLMVSLMMFTLMMMPIPMLMPNFGFKKV
jgi:hypothetical protein